MGNPLQPMAFESLDQVEALLWGTKGHSPAHLPFSSRTPHLNVGPPSLFREFSLLVKKNLRIPYLELLGIIGLVLPQFEAFSIIWYPVWGLNP